ncbi:MAG TPA: hypothetical protein VK806_05365 [Bacteroidia bacterium]|nr:hypothetical protein [Bacteroidia bacterium]
MPTNVSKEVIKEVKRLLPALRKEIKKEFEHWHHYVDGDEFHDDKKVMETLPYAAYEYIILCWGVQPERVNMPSVVSALNNKLFNDLRQVTSHALRRLASLKMNVTKA